MARFESTTIDGRPVLRRLVNITASDGWATAKDAAINYMGAGESDDYFYNTFNDADGVTGSGFALDATNKCLKNTQTASSPGGAIIPTMTSNTAPSGICFASSQYNTSYTPNLAFDKSTSTQWMSANGTDVGQYIGYAFAATQTVSSFTLTCGNSGFYPTSLKIQGTNDTITGSGASSNAASCTWSDIQTWSGLSWGSAETKTFTLSANATYKAYRIVEQATSIAGLFHVYEFSLIGAATPASVNPATIIPAAYTPETMPDKCKIKLWLENVDVSANAPDLGNSGSAAIECYISLNGGTTWSSALAFTTAALQPAPGVYVFDGGEIDTSAASAISVKLQSFARGENAAPNFAWHAVLVLQQ